MGIAFEVYLRLLGLLYLAGAYLHARRVLRSRRGYGSALSAELPTHWRAADAAYLALDLLAAAGLLLGAAWGVIAFVVVAGSQTVIFVAYPTALAGSEEGERVNRDVAWFHIATLLVLLILLLAR